MSSRGLLSPFVRKPWVSSGGDSLGVELDILISIPF